MFPCRHRSRSPSGPSHSTNGPVGRRACTTASNRLTLAANAIDCSQVLTGLMGTACAGVYLEQYSVILGWDGPLCPPARAAADDHRIRLARGNGWRARAGPGAASAPSTSPLTFQVGFQRFQAAFEILQFHHLDPLIQEGLRGSELDAQLALHLEKP